MADPELTTEDHLLSKIAQQLSGVTVIIIIAAGTLTFFILFIIAKRQIMRFTLRTHRGPHAPIGFDANKSLRREIMDRIDAIQKIIHEPFVFKNQDDDGYNEAVKLCHYYRMKTVDDAKELELAISARKLEKRQPHETLRSYFILTLTPANDPRLVHRFCDMYEAARYNPKPFGKDDYESFKELLHVLTETVRKLLPKTSIITPPRLQHSKNSPVKQARGTGALEEKIMTLSTPYVRKLSKKDKPKWTGNNVSEEETSLCDPKLVHEVSIISSSSKDGTLPANV